MGVKMLSDGYKTLGKFRVVHTFSMYVILKVRTKETHAP